MYFVEIERGEWGVEQDGRTGRETNGAKPKK